VVVRLSPIRKVSRGYGRRFSKIWLRKRSRLSERMVELLSLAIKHKDVRRICKHIIRYNQELFTFLDNPLLRQPIIALVRQLRPKVIMRKITFGNRSSSSASNQAVMMSIIQTGILHEIKPLNILLALSVKPLTSLTELPKIRSP